MWPLSWKVPVGMEAVAHAIARSESAAVRSNHGHGARADVRVDVNDGVGPPPALLDYAARQPLDACGSRHLPAGAG